MEPWLSVLEPFVTKTDADVEEGAEDVTTDVEDDEIRWEEGSPPITDKRTPPPPSKPGVFSWLSPPEVLLLGFVEL